MARRDGTFSSIERNWCAIVIEEQAVLELGGRPAVLNFPFVRFMQLEEVPMRSRMRFSRRSRISVAFAVGVLGMTLAAPTSGGSGATSRALVGLVFVNTNLGYQNAAGAGTGLVYRSGGDVLTNNHVIAGSTTIRVKDADNGKTYVATVVGYDVPADVAVLHLKLASGLKTAPLGNSATVRVGDKVVAVGNAGGAGTMTPSTGTVTALNQSIVAVDEANGTSRRLTGLIKTNASVEPGDSGGALVNAASRVIGVVTAGSSSYEFQGAEGTGFAIPIRTVTSIAGKILSGKFSGDIHSGATAFLGIYGRSAGYFSDGSFHFGILVIGVIPGSPAAKAGVAVGVVITGVNAKAVTSLADLTNLLLAAFPGTRLKLSWVGQDGAAQSKSVTLVSGPPA